MAWTYPFTTDLEPDISEVGGKGRSLILLTRENFPVPPGFVLGLAFFKPWFERIEQSAEMAALLAHPDDRLKERCQAVMAVCDRLELDRERQKILQEALKILPSDRAASLAVRSSSPEEDLKGASFAGGYQTLLGVSGDNLIEALRRCIASCLDERVRVYKSAHGFPVEHPRLAVIVQQQVDADASGVAFSLNPVNNCYDEAVINANSGLGESVVSGRVSPDTFIVDKVSRGILEKRPGSKQQAVRLNPAGGTYMETNHDPDAFTLSDHRVWELTDLICRVETFFGFPVDIEWAYENDTLYLLQARPITAYIPLPEIMLTRPGRPKRLYLDGSLAAQGLQRPLSVLGTDFMALSQDHYFHEFLGSDLGNDLVNGLYGTLEGRMYVNLGHQIKLTGLKRAISQYAMIDSLSAKIISGIDLAGYLPAKRPRRLRARFIAQAIVKNIAPGWRAFKAYRRPRLYLADVSKQRAIFERKTRSIIAQPGSIKEMIHRMLDGSLTYIAHALPTFTVAETARFLMKRILQKLVPDRIAEAVFLERAFPANTTIEMGFAMYELSRFEEIKASGSWPDLGHRLGAGRVGPGFSDAWKGFMDRYGFRCPMELDIATPRYHENPAHLFDQLRAMAENDRDGNHPRAVFEEARKKREDTFAGLKEAIRRKSKWKAKRFERYYRRLVAFGGYREVHKYYLMWMVDLLRRKILDIARSLTNDGRLDHPDQVFDLTFDDLDAVLRGEKIDLRARIDTNTRFLKTIRNVRSFPRIIDSRGRIFNAPPSKPVLSGLTGEPISPGVVRGKVTVFHTVHEKKIYPGEILVARATDPGWTPLFINAAGIVLEVGGLLQHGALVAREYGKPCIAGIPDVTRKLQDGQMIEMDGLSGEIRFL